MRLVDAVGKDVFKYELLPKDLNPNGTDPTGWTSTVVEVGVGTTEFSPNDTAGRVGTITCAANEDDGGSYQLLGENFELTADQDVYVGVELQTNDADQSDLLFGLCITDTALLGGMTDGVYFESLDAATAISTVVETGSAETQSDDEGDLADDTDIILELYWNGAATYFFINGVEVTRVAGATTEALRLSLEFLTGEAVANTCNIKWLRAIQIGR